MSDAKASALSDFFFLPDSEIKADVTIVLGMTLWQRPLARALALHAQGLAGKLIFTGGHNAKLATSEAQAMAQEAAKHGLSDDDYWTEAHASNTRENFVHCKELMSAHGIAPDCRLNIVAIAFHMRRAVMTAQDIFGGLTQIGTANYPSIHYANDSWQQSERGRQDVAGEMQKLAIYYPDAISPALAAAAQSLSAS